MIRMFLQDCGRFKKGESKDFPEGTWRIIAEQEGKKLEKLAAPVNENDRALFTQRRPVTH